VFRVSKNISQAIHGHPSLWNGFSALKSCPAQSSSGSINKNPNCPYTRAMELETVQSNVASAEYYKFHRFRMTICESHRVYSNLVWVHICLLKIVNQTYAVFVEAHMICCKSQVCWIDHPLFFSVFCTTKICTGDDNAVMVPSSWQTKGWFTLQP